MPISSLGVIFLMNGRDIAVFAARTADDKKATDIVIYDLRGLSDISDYFVLVTAHSRAQTRAILESVARELKRAGIHRIGQEGNDAGRWVLLDYGDCVVHIFSPDLREYYALESMWGDAPRLDWNQEPEVVLPRRKTGTDVA
ncbi:MAG TPA: ribosome silencing factor [Planctomycetota bacterium]|nr:ribosome silencing factor [Planctomycetota bacterium]